MGKGQVDEIGLRRYFHRLTPVRAAIVAALPDAFVEIDELEIEGCPRVERDSYRLIHQRRCLGKAIERHFRRIVLILVIRFTLLLWHCSPPVNDRSLSCWRC